MKYKLYQIPLNEQTRFYAFERREDLMRRGMYPPPRELYKQVFEDNCGSINPVAILTLHNQDDRPARMKIRSMSVSDILLYEVNGETLALFRDYVYFYPIIFTDDKISDIETEYFVRDGYAHVRLKYDEQDIDVDVSQMLNGGRFFKNASGEKVELGLTQRYAVFQAALIEQDKLKYSGKGKTYDEWTDSGAVDFDAYVGVGDEVDEAIVDNFLGMLPPSYHTAKLVQMGEPHEYLPNENGKFCPTYMTFERTDNKWYFRGYCFYGETQNRHRFLTSFEIFQKLLT